MKQQPVKFTVQSLARIACALALTPSCLFLTSCASCRTARDDLSVYRITNDQAGHEFAKTEQFLVPVRSVVIINGLEFEPGVSTLSSRQKIIVQQVFNCLEEITENTVNDTNSARVAENKKMKFEIRGYPDTPNGGPAYSALSEERAKAVMDWLTYLGTPPWRLKATGFDGRSAAQATVNSKRSGRVEFIRLQ